MTFWHVVTKFFDSGKVKVNLAPIEADCKPENHMSENKTCDAPVPLPLKKSRWMHPAKCRTIIWTPSNRTIMQS